MYKLAFFIIMFKKCLSKTSLQNITLDLQLVESRNLGKLISNSLSWDTFSNFLHIGYLEFFVYNYFTSILNICVWLIIAFFT